MKDEIKSFKFYGVTEQMSNNLKEYIYKVLKSETFISITILWFSILVLIMGSIIVFCYILVYATKIGDTSFSFSWLSLLRSFLTIVINCGIISVTVNLSIAILGWLFGLGISYRYIGYTHVLHTNVLDTTFITEVE